MNKSNVSKQSQINLNEEILEIKSVP